MFVQSRRIFEHCESKINLFKTSMELLITPHKKGFKDSDHASTQKNMLSWNDKASNKTESEGSLKQKQMAEVAFAVQRNIVVKVQRNKVTKKSSSNELSYQREEGEGEQEETTKRTN